MIKAIIFDFDGVILDSTKIKTDAFINIFKHKHSEYLPEILDHHHNHLGISRSNKLRIYFEDIIKIKLTNFKLQNFIQLFSDYCLNRILNCNFIPGARQFIVNNHKSYKFFISSGTPTKELKYICKYRKLDMYFHRIYGSPQKKSTHIKRIKKIYKLKSNEIIFLGDGMSDYKAAKENKLNFIGINYKNNLNITDRILIKDLKNFKNILKSNKYAK